MCLHMETNTLEGIVNMVLVRDVVSLVMGVRSLWDPVTDHETSLAMLTTASTGA